MGNCECLRNNEDSTTEIKHDFQLKGYEKDYGSTSKGKAKNINNFIFDDDEENKQEPKKEEPPVIEDRFHVENKSENSRRIVENDFAATFKPEENNDNFDLKSEPRNNEVNITDHKEEIVLKPAPETNEVKVEEEKVLDRSTMSGESDLESKLFY